MGPRYTQHELDVIRRLLSERWPIARIAVTVKRSSSAVWHQVGKIRAADALQIKHATRKPRPCLGLDCTAMVQSEHAGHRMCDTCRRRDVSPFEP